MSKGKSSKTDKAGFPRHSTATSLVATGVHICPLYFSYQINGVYYYYAIQCGTQISFIMTSTVQVTKFGCAAPNPFCKTPLVQLSVGKRHKTENHSFSEITEFSLDDKGLDGYVPDGDLPIVTPGWVAVREDFKAS